MRRHLAPAVASIALVATLLYVGSYAILVEVGPRESGVRNPVFYAAGGDWVYPLFAPVHYLDTKIRVRKWHSRLYWDAEYRRQVIESHRRSPVMEGQRT